VTTSSTSPPSSASPAEALLAGTPVHARWTSARDGDLRSIGDGPAPAPVPAGVAVRRVRQVHGAGVVVVGAPPPNGTVPWARGPGETVPEGDALVATGPGVALAVLSADCATVALGSPEGVSGAVHAGWRGLAGGVLARAVGTMRALGARTVVAGLGPCIGACCYEFSPGDLELVLASCGPGVRGRTTWGRPALDLRGAVGAQLAGAGVEVAFAQAPCTACTPGYFSYRARRDEARQALFVWR
jgi:polyphenol oxidase